MNKDGNNSIDGMEDFNLSYDAQRKTLETLRSEISKKRLENARLEEEDNKLSIELDHLRADAATEAASEEEIENKIEKVEEDITQIEALTFRMMEILKDPSFNPIKNTRLDPTELMLNCLDPFEVPRTGLIELAIQRRDIKDFDAILKNIHDKHIDTRDSTGKTFMMHSVINGFLHGVKSLLERGSNPEICDKNGDTALHFAVVSGNLEIINTLLESGVDIYSVNLSEETPFAKLAKDPYLSSEEKLPATKALLLAAMPKEDLNCFDISASQNTINIQSHEQTPVLGEESEG